MSTRASWETIAAQCGRHLAEGRRPLVVCSALSGISNALENAANSAAGDQYTESLDEVILRHKQMADALNVDFNATCGDILADLTRILTGSALLQEVSLRQWARIMSAGEMMSSRLGAAFLQQSGVSAAWLDARTVLQSVDDPTLPLRRRVLQAQCDAAPDPALPLAIQSLSGEVALTQGFIARDESGHTVLLGRGGSDTSATYFAAKLQAERCEIWTDVPGMFTANPRKVPSARLLKRLSYEEAQEIASTGAEVLHPRCIAPARKYGIPIHIRCTPHHDMPGTIISSDSLSQGPQVKAMSARYGVTLVSMDTVGMWHQVGFLADVFQVFKRHDLSIDLVSTSETNVTVSLDPGIVTTESPAIKALLAELKPFCRARAIGPSAAVSVVGNHIRGMFHKLGPALEVFEEQAIHLVSQAASDLNITFVVEEGQAERLVAGLHDLLITGSESTPIMGPTWLELFGDDSDSVSTVPAGRWWRERIPELLSLQKDTPAYVYHVPTIQKRARQLMAVPPLDRVFYAMKANSNPEILRTLYDMGVGLECVSPGEIRRAQESIVDLDPKRILFTPNFAPMDEYAFGFDVGIHVTLDNVFPLVEWPDIFRNKDIIVRMDPGEGRGHHKHVRTAGASSKFGISVSELPQLIQAAKTAGARIVGLHAHSGSGIRTPDNWSHIGMFLGRIADQIPTVRHIDVGGGLGVVERVGDSPLNLGSLASSLEGVKRAFPNLEIWMEPGRYLVAEAGVLLTKVTQLKSKGETRYIGVNAGMNALIRPALYGSWHTIVNLDKIDEPLSTIANVVGPICESGDTLGRKRHLPDTSEGDVLLVDVTGAYGYSMRSDYNLRGEIPEIMLLDN